MSLEFSEAVKRAKQAVAYREVIEDLESMSGWDDFVRHPKAHDLAYWYARHIARGRVPDLEPIIARDAAAACEYVRDILHTRFADAEPTIAKHPDWACNYARDVIGGPWPEAEPVILSDDDYAWRYEHEVLERAEP